ncbi:SDR family oxidoreductase [Paractinoplanes lichenicola]|uniref:SDR family oxidoreductase n=1 Tax=Paractinoplanes lichenicola TaxID=2802976 RepID=A0ABS1VMT1_9ACTN|nr:SDR family oxidoreductase [Actinoplanes lichenicola]MBL7255963.1 SDR family oxidoreductase [Actinoplanes lichenicola]
MRTYAISGAASGIGRAAKELLEADGHRVIGIDLRDADVIADLSGAQGRASMVRDVTAISGGRLDAVLAVAGLASNSAATARVNYFGMLATLEGLRPLLEQSDAPRAVAVASMAVMFPHDAELAAAFEAGDEAAAVARAEVLAKEEGQAIYATSKRTIARWVRRAAPSADWAGKGIALNAVAPGVIATPMMADSLASAENRRQLESMVPMPLGGIAKAEDVAELLRFLSSVENGHMCGQVVFIDGGADAVMRGDTIFPLT